MTPEQLKHVIEQHELWLETIHKEGQRANLADADLTNANLAEADLRDANLTNANLTDANLTDVYLWDANLTNANLTRADLTDVYLRDANLTNANLTDADLTDVYLWGAVGNGKEVKNIEADKYKIAYTHDILQIGCKNYSFEQWREFPDDVIDAMGYGALDWWRENKERIFDHIAKYPAVKPDLSWKDKS